MKAVLRTIESGDERDWEEVINSVPDPWKATQHLIVAIGSDESDGSDLFEVWVATPAGKHLAVDDRGRFRGVLVDHFDADSVRKELRNSIEAIEGDSWLEVARKLCEFMHWEYEGMDATGATGAWP